jgi:hypothetical protein
MRNFINKLLSGESEISSKRFITLVAFFLMGTGFITNLFWGLTVEEFIYDSMKWIVIGGLGFTASEQFSKTKNDKDNNTKQDTNDEEPIDYYSDKNKGPYGPLNYS